jgi:hypothetical protein
LIHPRFRQGLRPGITPAGFAVIAIALVLLIRSLTIRNAYEIVLSAVVTLLWVVLYAAGRWGKRRLSAMEPNWKPPSPLTANTQEETLITGLGFPAPWFFRLHVIIEGRFFPSGDPEGCPVFLETAVAERSPSASIRLSFPMSGVFQGEGSCRLKDIFGFLSFHCGVPQQRTVNVMCPPTVRKQLRVDPQSGAEDRRSKTSDDEERYYMREYAPGDRFRDINWKSSERIATLITRISPDTHERTCRIEVYFRNYGPTGATARALTRASLEELWLLDRAKARLAQFLRLLKESDDKYIFTVYTAQDTWDLESKEELEAFLEKLAALPFSPAVNQSPLAIMAGELFVFSTACDRGLQSFLITCNPRPVTVFLVESADDKRRDEAETLAVSDFTSAGCVPLPGWLFRRDKRRLTVAADHIERDYADTCLWKK